MATHEKAELPKTVLHRGGSRSHFWAQWDKLF